MFKELSFIAVEVQVALVTGLLGLIALITKLYFSSKTVKEKVNSRPYRKVLEGMDRSRQSYKLIEEMRRKTTASRVILFAGHNSGGIPRPGTPFYTSAIWWSIDDAAEESENRVGFYNRLVVDAEYMGMLLDSEENGVVALETERMPQCLLKKYYHAEGICHSVVLFVAITEMKFVYVTAAKFEDVPFTEDEITRLRLMADAIRETMK